MTDPLGRLPFDQYQRYAFTARVLDVLRQADQPLQLLEVGAYAHRNLEKFQPRDQVIYLDNETFADLPTNGHFVQGDAAANPFRKGAFDLVIAPGWRAGV
jgi:hypothetical protein